jgi:hypothetical protein
LAKQHLRENIKLNWFNILERPPFCKLEEIKVLVDSRPELYPTENLFLEELKKHICVEFIPQLSTSAIENNFLDKPLDISTTQASKELKAQAIFWAWSGIKSQVAELTQRFHFVPSLDLPQFRPQKDPQLIRALYLWVDYLNQGKPDFHVFNRNQIYVELLQSHFSQLDFVNENKVFELLCTHFSRDKEKLKQIKDYIDFKDPLDWQFLKELGCFGEEHSREIFPQSHPEGLALLNLEDFPWCASKNIYFWGTQESLLQYLDPLSPAVLNKKLFPTKVEEWLKMEGWNPPSPEEEARRLQEIIFKYSSQIQLTHIDNLEAVKIDSPTHFNTPLTPASLTPTSLESLFRCPKQFYFQRILKLQDEKGWDEEQLDARHRGSWLHKVLELFFINNDWQSPEQTIKTLLEESVDEIFQLKYSKPYKELISKQSHALAQKLAAHIHDFEIPLKQKLKPLKYELEKPIESILNSQKLRGKIDRIDYLENGVLIWDFKSGNYSKSQKSLIQNGYFQWWIYYEVWNQLYPKLPVLGGGYINPLDREKSRLISLPGLNNELASTWNSIDYKTDVFTEDDLNLFINDYKVLMNTLFESIEKKNYPPKPIRTDICNLCAYKSACGKVFLEGNT